MRKGVHYSIERVGNGYYVNYSWQELEEVKTEKSDYKRWSYKDEGAIFKTIDEVIEWLRNKETEGNESKDTEPTVTA